MKVIIPMVSQTCELLLHGDCRLGIYGEQTDTPVATLISVKQVESTQKRFKAKRQKAGLITMVGV